MDQKFLNARSPLRLLEKSLHGGLGRGNLGVVLAGHGVGKAAFLVNVAIDELMRGARVLHVRLDAVKVGAEALVLSCPLCEYNLGKRQGELVNLRKASKQVPTYYFTQLLAVALGLGPEARRFEVNDVSSRQLRKNKGFPV